MASDPMTLCPQCGPGVSVDEDGCCVSCGCVAVGPGIMVALDAARAEEREASARECELYAAVHRKLGEARSVYPERVRPPVGDAAACEACAAAIRGRG
jgi:hypothetical protein